MSTLPRKCAPSAMATRGEMMSPSTEPPSRMSTFSDAVTLPLTSPSTMTALANTCALILPFGPIVSTWSFSSILPFDVTLDREVLAAVQLALDDDRLADVHHVPLDPPGLRLRRRRRTDRLSGCDRCRRRRLAAVGFTASSRFHISFLRLDGLILGVGPPLKGWAQSRHAFRHTSSKWLPRTLEYPKAGLPGREPTEYIGR